MMRTAARMAIVFAFTCIQCLGLCGCRDRRRPRPARPAATRPAKPEPVWTATRKAILEGMNAPESFVIDPATGVGYISNIEAAPDKLWADDQKGFISRVMPGGILDEVRWKDGTEGNKLSSPRGMCIYDGAIFVADNTRVCRLALDTAGTEGPVKGLEGVRLNDIATDGSGVFVSDTGAGKVYRIIGRAITEIKAPEGVNGITFHGGKMYAVSWTLHDVFELDPEGKADPKPFGLAKHFMALDGIEVLDDGTFIVSDYEGNKVCTIAPDRETVHTLCKAKLVADIGLAPRSGLLFVPQLSANNVVVYTLDRNRANE